MAAARGAGAATTGWEAEAGMPGEGAAAAGRAVTGAGVGGAGRALAARLPSLPPRAVPTGPPISVPAAPPSTGSAVRATETKAGSDDQLAGALPNPVERRPEVERLRWTQRVQDVREGVLHLIIAGIGIALVQRGPQHIGEFLGVQAFGPAGLASRPAV